jgi:acyl dehydratase
MVDPETRQKVGLSDRSEVILEQIETFGEHVRARDLKWVKPVYPGDTISYGQEVIDKRASLTRRQWGIVTARNTGTNQHGELVLSFVSSAFVERKPQRQRPEP